MSNDNKQRELYNMRANSLRDKISELDAAEKKGLAKGMERGIEEGKKEVAINLLDVLDDETIALKTGLSIDIIKVLRKENKK